MTDWEKFVKKLGRPYKAIAYHHRYLGSYLTKLQPDFDSRLYGFKKLSDMVRA